MIRPANALLLSSLFLAAPIAASASPITYAVNEVFPGFSAVGTITTDGTIGDLSAADITNFNLLLTEGSNSATINTGVVTREVGLYATTLALAYNYTASEFSLFELGIPSSGNTFCIGDPNSCVSSSGNEVFVQVAGNYASAAQTGAQLIGTTVSVTPEPSSIILFVTGLVGIMLSTRRRLA